MTTVQELKIDNSSVLAAKLQGKHFSKNTVKYTLADLAAIDARSSKMIEHFLKVFAPESLTQEDFTPVIVSAKQNSFDRIYGPIVCKADGQIVISVGLVNIPLVTDSKGVVKHETLEIETSLFSGNFNGYDDTPVVGISIFNPEKDVTLAYELPIKFKTLAKDEKLPTLKELATMFKRSPANLLGWLGDPPKPQLPTIPAKNLVPGIYEVVGYDTFTTNDNRQTGTLTVRGQYTEDGLLAQEYIDPEDETRESYIDLEYVNVWLPKEIMGSISLSPVVSEEFPATLSIRSVKPGKKAGSFKVDLGWQLNPNAPVAAEAEEDLSMFDF